MRKLVLDIRDLNYTPEFLGASPLALGAWLRLSMYCATYLTGGRIEDCKSWDTLRWSRACGLDWASLAVCTEAGLAEWVGLHLDVVGYSLDQEKAYKSKVKGAKLSRAKRLCKSSSDKVDSDIRVDISSDIPSLPFSSDSSSLSSPNAEEDIGSPSQAAAGPVSDSDHWRMKLQHEPWVRSLKDALCKIGPGTWRQWSTIIAAHGLPVTVSAAKGVPAPDRWPDAVDKALTASRGQANPGDVVASRIHKVTL